MPLSAIEKAAAVKMAKRRKRGLGAPLPAHEVGFRAAVTEGHAELDRAEGSLDAGECGEALFLYGRATASFGKAFAHAESLPSWETERPMAIGAERLLQFFDRARERCVRGRGFGPRSSEEGRFRHIEVDGARRRRRK